MTLKEAKTVARELEGDGGEPVIKDDRNGGYKVYDYATNEVYYEKWELKDPLTYSRTHCEDRSDADPGL